MVRYLCMALGLGMVFILSACSSVTKQRGKTMMLDASQEDTLGGTGASSADIRTMAEEMSQDIAAIYWEDPQVLIALTTIENETRFPINPNIIKDRLLSDLVNASINTKIRYSEKFTEKSDFKLSARITALSKGSMEGVSDYLLYTFKLVDRDDTVRWSKSYETKKQGKVGVMYR